MQVQQRLVTGAWTIDASWSSVRSSLLMASNFVMLSADG